MIQGSRITQDLICNKFDELEKKRSKNYLREQRFMKTEKSKMIKAL